MENLDQLIDLLRKGEDPNTVCKDMHYCPKNDQWDSILKPSTNNCMYCNGVLILLEIALKQKPDQIQVARELAGIVCGMLASDDKVCLCVHYRYLLTLIYGLVP